MQTKKISIDEMQTMRTGILLSKAARKVQQTTRIDDVQFVMIMSYILLDLLAGATRKIDKAREVLDAIITVMQQKLPAAIERVGAGTSITVRDLPDLSVECTEDPHDLLASIMQIGRTPGVDLEAVICGVCRTLLVLVALNVSKTESVWESLDDIIDYLQRAMPEAIEHVAKTNKPQACH